MMKRKAFFSMMLGLSLLVSLFTSAYEDGIYELEDENGNAVKTIIWGDTQMTIAMEDLPGTYYWGFNVNTDNSVWDDETSSTIGVEYNNAWGGGDDTYENGWDSGNDRVERQGPCEDGYHVPSIGEREGLLIAWCNVDKSCDLNSVETHGTYYGIYDSINNIGLKFIDVFNMNIISPYAWAVLRSSSPSDDGNSFPLFADSRYVGPDLGVVSWRGNHYVGVRCFKNYAVLPQIPLQTITFNTNGGTTIETQEVENGATLDEPTHPTKAHSIFAGWYMDNMLTQEFDFDTPISGDMTLYAKWDCEDGYYPLNNGQMCFTYETISIADPNDPTKGITIMDRNLGATTTGAGTVGGEESYGYYYQWGNNYGFPTTGVVTNTTSNRIDVSSYGSNEYSSDTWIKGKLWTQKNSDVNLRGGGDEKLLNNRGLDNLDEMMELKQGICPSGYHMPSIGEWNNLFKYWLGNYNNKNMTSYIMKGDEGYGFLDISGLGEIFVEDLNIPYGGLRRYNDSLSDQMGSWAYLRSTSPTSVSNSYSRVFFVFANALGADDLARGYAVPLRCFSNEYIPETASLTLNSDNEVVDSQNVVVGTTATKPSSPTKSGYKFIGRYEEGSNVEFDFENTVIDRDIILIAKWEKNTSNGGGGWSGGGGGGGMKKDNCPDGDFSPSYYDGECGEKASGSVDTQDSSDKSSEGQTGDTQDSSADKSASEGQNNSQKLSGDSQELFSMHQWAYDNGLTIYKPGEDAKFDKPLTRQQMAKISSIFGAKFLNQKADDSEGKIMECSQYKDLSKSKGEMRGYVVQSCLMKNMGYASDGVNLIKKFKPYDKLTVAQASVILSRMVWGDKYVLDSKQWYQGHMQAVYEHELIDDISDPSRVITRGEAFTMMYRLSQLMEGEK